MLIVGSSIAIIGKGSGFSLDAIVSPISMLSTPTIAQISPHGTSSTSTFFNPSYTNNCFGDTS